MDFYAKIKAAREKLLSNDKFEDMPLAYHDDLLSIPKQLLIAGFDNDDELPEFFDLELIYPWNTEELKKILEELIDIKIDRVRKRKEAFYLHSNSFSIRIKK